MYNGCLKHATKLIPEKDGQGKTWQQIPKWRWPQKRYGTPEKSSLESQNWNLDKTRSQWTVYGWKTRWNSIQRREKRKMILECASQM